MSLSKSKVTSTQQMFTMLRVCKNTFHMPSLTSRDVSSALVLSFLLHVFIFSILVYGFSFAPNDPSLNCDST